MKPTIPLEAKIGCAVLGATGTVGQRFVELLDNHPRLELRAVAASERNQGRPYVEATQWRLDEEMPDCAAGLVLESIDAIGERNDIRVVFSALPGDEAGPIERALADQGKAVFTNAKDLRMAPDVPLLIPEVNPEHMELVAGKRGFVVANGNCSGIVLTLALAPLHRAFGIEEVHVTTFQGLSGAGHPGVPSLDIIDNVIPFIGGEEDKLETEPQRILGGMVQPAHFQVHATCARVPVREGHLESVHVRLKNPASLKQLTEAFESFRGPDEVAKLHTAPNRPIHVDPRADRPQPRLDRDREQGMSVTVGRIRPSGDWVRFFVLGHNTLRGAAGQSILNAEYADAIGLL